MEFIYNDMTRAQLDDAYQLAKGMDFPAILADFLTRSETAYQTFPCERNIPYAGGARNTLDYFPSSRENAPTLIFIHGGFWQSTTKEHYAFITEGLLADFQVIMAEYTLAPQASMSQINGEIAAMLNFLRDNAPRFRLQPGKVCLCGHSAGAHLTAMHRSHPLISHAMWMSGIADLTPISLCFLNDNLQLTPGEIQIFSPANSMIKGVPMAVTVGAAERPEMIRQSERYVELLKACGNHVEFTHLPGENHFSQMYQFSADGSLTAALKQLMGVA